MGRLGSLVVGGTLAFSASAALASAFQLLEQNASGLGNAYAGSAAVAEDASTVYFNPAGMALLPQGRTVVTYGMNAILPSAKFTDAGSTLPTYPGIGGTAGAIPAGANGGNAGSLAFVPHAYVVAPINAAWSFGLGLGAPFGLKTEYDPSWKGRFRGVTSDIETLNLNPSLSYKVDEKLSIGGGLNFQRLQGEFTSGVFYPGALYEKLEPLAGSAIASGVANLAPEGRARILGASNAWGFNVGVMLKLSETMRVGVSYRSPVKHHLKGKAEFSATGNPLLDSTLVLRSPTSPARGGEVYSDVKLPDTLIFSTQLQLDDQWELLGDLSWTGWAKIPVLQFNYVDGNDLVSKTDENWRNTWRVALGATYKYNNQWKWRAGLAYDQTPVPDAFRTVRLPDQDRIWLSTGAQFKPSTDTAIDIGYTHIFVKNSTINGSSDAALEGHLQGAYKNKVNILGAQFSTLF